MKKKKGSVRSKLNRGSGKPRWRVLFLSVFILLLFAGVAYRAVELQIIDRERAYKVAKRQHRGTSTLLPRRGRILDRNHRDIAVNVDVKSVFVNPANVKDPIDTAQALSKILDIPQKTALNRISSKRSFVWLKRLADPQAIKQLEEMDLEGIGFVEEPKRVYPNRHLLGQVVGITNIDSKGIEGIEYYYDNLLIGKPREITLRRDAKGRRIISNPDNVQEFNRDKTSGHDIVLTVDTQIQHIVERELEEGIKAMNAEKGMALLMNTETGEIMAMASYPFLDPNDFGSQPEKDRRNLPIWFMFEPGSTMKVFLAASAIEEKKVTPSTVFYCENGRRKVGSKVIRDVSPRGDLTVEQAIVVSSNICASKIGELLGRDKYHDYLERFGFGSKTGIDLPGESAGLMLPSRKWGQIELATISFGQGISVTALQITSALAAIANGGYLMKPYIVKRIIAPDGSIIKENEPEVLRRVISYDTSREITEIMKNVVDTGTGKRAAIPGIPVAGKTGTAQIPDPRTGGYHPDRYIASFIGFAPADDPKIALAVIVEAPKKKSHGGSVSAPIFKEIAEKVLFHLGVSPANELVGAKVMPDLSGMSVREILNWSEKQGIKVKLSGSGFVKSQEPKPGDLIKEGMVCSIELQQNI